jgi:hypothetical protein
MMQVFVCDFGEGDILLQMQWKGLALEVGNKELSL